MGNCTSTNYAIKPDRGSREGSNQVTHQGGRRPLKGVTIEERVRDFLRYHRIALTRDLKGLIFNGSDYLDLKKHNLIRYSSDDLFDYLVGLEGEEGSHDIHTDYASAFRGTFTAVCLAIAHSRHLNFDDPGTQMKILDIDNFMSAIARVEN